jgi:hypothetical protein
LSLYKLSAKGDQEKKVSGCSSSNKASSDGNSTDSNEYSSLSSTSNSYSSTSISSTSDSECDTSSLTECFKSTKFLNSSDAMVDEEDHRKLNYFNGYL